MLDYQARARQKAEQITGDGLAALLRARAAREQPMAFVGGQQPDGLDAQIAFQQWRIRILRRCEAATAEQIHGWITACMDAMTPEEWACRDGDVRHLSPRAYRAACAAVLYELALGGD